MLLIKTRISMGCRCVSEEAISAGTQIWSFDSRFDKIISDAEAASLPEHLKEELSKRAVRHGDTGSLIMDSGNALMITSAYSLEPNVEFRLLSDDPKDMIAVAIRDIAWGDELLCVTKDVSRRAVAA